MATINVPADQATIALAIAAASASDIVLVAAGTYTLSGVVLNKAIILRTTAGAIIQASTPGSGTGVRIASSGCTVDGFDIREFNIGIGVTVSDLVGYNTVSIKNNRTYRSQYHVWGTGNDWTVEDNEFDKVRRWGGGDADYTRFFGTGHIIRRNYFHGTTIPDDLAPGPDYAHCDCIQTYNQNGEVFQDIEIYENYCTDFVQGIFIADEFTDPTAIANVSIHDNVFIGTNWAPTGNLIGQPSHGIFFGKDEPPVGCQIYNNLLYNIANAISVDFQSRGSDVIVQNNIIYDYGTRYNTNGADIDFGTGNLHFAGGWPGAFGTNGVDLQDDPEFTNIGAPLGLDGIPMTVDDGWWPEANTTYGPQIGFGVDTTPPVITLTGSATMNWNQSQGAWVEPGFTAIDSVDGDVSGDVVIAGDVVDVDTPGAYVITYNVQDTATNAAVEKTRTVTVVDNVHPVITRVGSASVTIAVSDPYVDDGATATDNVDGTITGSIVVTGIPVDTNTAGTYTIRYNVEDAAGNDAIEVTRTLNIDDETIPVITLVGPASMAFSINETAQTMPIPGATAVDDTDGDISADIVRTGTVVYGQAGVYLLFYNVSDSFANAATQVTRTVTIVDDRIPVIILNGPDYVEISVGDTYTDAGAVALDETDGDLSGDIVVTGTVNEAVAGTYILRYNVVDSHGNTATEKTRTVSVQTAPSALPAVGRNTISAASGLLYYLLATKRGR